MASPVLLMGNYPMDLQVSVYLNRSIQETKRKRQR